MERRGQLPHTIGARVHWMRRTRILGRRTHVPSPPLPDIKGFGIEATADQIGLGLTAVAAAGVTAHAIVTNIQKRKLIKNQMDNDDINKEEFAVEEHQIEREEKRLGQKAHKLEKDKDNR